MKAPSSYTNGCPLQMRVRRPALTVFLERSLAASHCQNDAELCLAVHHARVSLARFFQWISFDHGTHAAQFGKVQRILGIRRRSRGPALNRSTSGNELHRRDL